MDKIFYAFNEKWYSDKQAFFLQDLIHSVSHLNGTIIEIGCWEGFSTYHIANACFPEILICNDTWKGNVDEIENHPSVKMAER